MITDFERGVITGLVIGEGAFSGDGREPVLAIGMHVRHEQLLRWVHARLPGSRLYGPYEHAARRSFKLLVRGPALRRFLRDHGRSCRGVQRRVVGQGDGREPVLAIGMHVRHEQLLRWVHARLPGSRLYGPYEHAGRRSFRLLVRGPALRRFRTTTTTSAICARTSPGASSGCASSTCGRSCRGVERRVVGQADVASSSGRSG